MIKLSRPRQNEMIQMEIEKWNKVFVNLPGDKRKAVILGILEEDIKIKGPAYKFKNGAQEMFIENPSQKSYNTMINRYTTTCDKLISLLPKDEGGNLPKRFMINIKSV